MDDQFIDRPKLKEFVKIDWIMGGTLDRYCIVSKKGQLVRCIVRQPSIDDQRLQCDACERRHSPINVNCSRNLHKRSWAKKPFVLYDFKSRKPLQYKHNKVDEEWGPHTLGYETWRILQQEPSA